MFTKDAVSEALHSIVAEKGGDYVYPFARKDDALSCAYAERDELGQAYPSCIVGHVVARLAPDVFESIAAFEVTEGESFGADELPDRGFEPEGNAIDALAVAQILQDLGYTWAAVQEAFDRVLAGDPPGDSDRGYKSTGEA